MYSELLKKTYIKISLLGLWIAIESFFMWSIFIDLFLKLKFEPTPLLLHITSVFPAFLIIQLIAEKSQMKLQKKAFLAFLIIILTAILWSVTR